MNNNLIAMLIIFNRIRLIYYLIYEKKASKTI